MRIVDRRFLAALLGLWLVLAVGLAAQAAPSEVTINVPCSPCPYGEYHEGGPYVIITVEGLSIKNNTDLTGFWLWGSWAPNGYQRLHVNPDGTGSASVLFPESGTQQLCVTYHQGASIRTLACVTVEVSPEYG